MYFDRAEKEFHRDILFFIKDLLYFIEPDRNMVHPKSVIGGNST